MLQLQLALLAGAGGDLAVARLGLTLEKQLQRNQAGLAAGRVDEAAGAELVHRHLGIGALGVAALHHKGNGIPHHPVEHGAVVGAAAHQIHEIAGREGGGVPIKTELHHALAGGELHHSLALQAGHASGATAQVSAGALGGTGHRTNRTEQQSQGQQQGPEPTDQRHHTPSRGTPRKRASSAPPCSSSARGIGSPTRVRGRSRRPCTRRARRRRGLRPSRTSTFTA